MELRLFGPWLQISPQDQQGIKRKSYEPERSHLSKILGRVNTVDGVQQMKTEWRHPGAKQNAMGTQSRSVRHVQRIQQWYATKCLINGSLKEKKSNMICGIYNFQGTNTLTMAYVKLKMFNKQFAKVLKMCHIHLALHANHGEESYLGEHVVCESYWKCK